MRISDWSSDVCSSDLVADASRKAKELVQWATELQREPCSINELWVSTKCGESDTTSGLASNPTVGNFIDKFDDLGATTCFGETSELTGAEQRSEEHTSELQSLMRNSYAVFCLKKKTQSNTITILITRLYI